MLEHEIGDVAEIHRVVAEQRGECGGINRLAGQIEFLPFRITAGEQTVNLAHVIRKRQGRAGRQYRVGFEQALQFRRHFHDPGGAGDRVLEVDFLRFEDDFECVRAGEVIVDRANGRVELGIVPQQVAALDRVADFDL